MCFSYNILVQICILLMKCVYGNEALHLLEHSVTVTNGLSSRSATSPLLPPRIICAAQSAVPSHLILAPFSSTNINAANDTRRSSRRAGGIFFKMEMVFWFARCRKCGGFHLGWHWCRRAVYQIDTGTTGHHIEHEPMSNRAQPELSDASSCSSPTRMSKPV